MMTCSNAVIIASIEEKLIEFRYEYENEIQPRLYIDDNWIDKIHSKENFISLIENTFLDVYEDIDDNEISNNLSQTMSEYEDPFIEEKYQKFLKLIENAYNNHEKINYLLLGVAVGPGSHTAFKWVKYDFTTKRKYSEDDKDINSTNVNQQEQFLERAIQNAIAYKVK